MFQARLRSEGEERAAQQLQVQNKVFGSKEKQQKHREKMVVWRCLKMFEDIFELFSIPQKSGNGEW